MKPILKVITVDKNEEATINALFEDLYNRVIPGNLLNIVLKSGKLDRPHIDYSSTGTEFNYAYVYLHCIPVPEALIYVWRYRKRATTRWTHGFSVENETKIPNLFFTSDYEFGVLAIGPMLIKSEWSYTILVMTADPPQPTKVANVAVTDEALYIDPTTGVTLASVKVEWDNNATDEYVDVYESLWY